MTLYGKVLIIKSLLVSKLLHLFTALPNPQESFIKQLNTELYRFIWKGKIDRISRKSAILPRSLGGIGMIEIDSMIASLKTTWVRRYMLSQNSWTTLVDLKIGDGSFFWDRNAVSLRILASRVQSKFWQDVIKSVALFRENYNINIEEISSCNLWFSDVTKYTENMEVTWHRRGLRCLNDILDLNGNILDFENLKNLYGIRGTQFSYNMLLSSIPRQWRLMNKQKCICPNIHPAMQFIMSQLKGAKHIYDVLLRRMHVGHVNKWERTWEAQLGVNQWTKTYKNICKATKSTQYRSLHYKIITRTVVTNVLLSQMRLKDTTMCLRCDISHETIYHKFWECRHVRQFWCSVHQWLVECGATGVTTEFNGKQIMFGHGSSDFINHVIIVGKSILQKGNNLSMQTLKSRLDYDRSLEEAAAGLNGNITKHIAKWEKFSI